MGTDFLHKHDLHGNPADRAIRISVPPEGHDHATSGGRPSDSPGNSRACRRRGIPNRWKAIQKGKLKGLSLRAISRELGISHVTVRKYAYAAKPPTQKLSAKELAKLMALRKSTAVAN